MKILRHSLLAKRGGILILSKLPTKSFYYNCIVDLLKYPVILTVAEKSFSV